MILNLTRIEISVLLLHMTISRKNIKKGFKRNYTGEHKEMMAIFDEIKKGLENSVMNDSENEVFHHNIREINMIYYYLDWYIARLDETLKKAAKLANKSVLDEDMKQLDCLQAIQHKVERLKFA